MALTNAHPSNIIMSSMEAANKPWLRDDLLRQGYEATHDIMTDTIRFRAPPNRSPNRFNNNLAPWELPPDAISAAVAPTKSSNPQSISRKKPNKLLLLLS